MDDSTAGTGDSGPSLRSLFEAMDLGVVYQDRDARIIAANPAAERILGLTRDQLLGRTSFDPRWRAVRQDGSDFPGAEHPSVVALRTGAPVRGVPMGVYHPAAGTFHWIVIDAFPEFRPGESRPFQAFTLFRDVTDQRAAEAALRESETRYRTLFDTMHEGFAFHEVICDDAGEVVDFRYLDLNPAFERLTGLKRETTVGRTVREVLPGIEAEWIRFYGQVALTGEPAEQERYVQELDRYYRAQAYSPRRGTFAVVFEETTAQRRAQRGLERRERLYNDLVETATDLVWRCDQEGRYTFLNKAWERAFGYPLGEMLGRRFTDFMAAEQAERDVATFARLLAEQGRVEGYETVHRRKDGTPVHLVFNATHYHDDAGRTVGTQGTAHDVTERRRHEEERLSLERQLLHAQKLESLGVLAGGIAHDFNNLLMVILGNADLAMNCVAPGSPAHAGLAAITEASTRAADLSRQMLAYSGKGRFVIGPVELNELLADLLHMLEVSVSKRAALRLRPHRPLPDIEADATQLRQVVMNLVINASEAIGDRDGVIAVSTGVRDCDRVFLDAAWPERELPEGRYVVLEVADTGCGMSPETLARLYDPFFSTKFAGRGLGMSAVLGIVRGHGGAITVESAPGRGTTFTVLLPVSGRPPARPGGTGALGQWAGTGKVLLVDDEASVRAVGVKMLRALGFTPVTAADGVEGLEAFRRDPGGFAAVILDLTMPRMGGEACFREIRGISPGAKVLIASGFGEQEVEPLAAEGLAGFIPKPYALTALREALRKAVSS